MKKIKKILVLGLSILLIGTTLSKAEAKVIQGSKGKTYITLDKTEIEENKIVLEEYFKITSYKTIISKDKKTYTVKFKSNKNTKTTKKIVKQVANKLHGNNIEKEFKEYRTYNIKVIGVDKNGKSNIYYIRGHKVS